MKHNVNELYIIRHNNKRIFATLAFCNSNDICTSRREAKEQGKTLFAYQASHLEGDKIKIYDTDEILCGYIGSTTVWFDTETERNDYKEQAKKNVKNFWLGIKSKKKSLQNLTQKLPKN